MKNLYKNILKEVFNIADFDSWDDSEQTFKNDIADSIRLVPKEFHGRSCPENPIELRHLLYEIYEVFGPGTEDSPIDLNWIDISKLTSFSSNINTDDIAKGESAAQGIFECGSFQYIDISKWDTHKITDMSWTFALCEDLVSVGDLSGWKVDKVTNMRYMFWNCYDLQFVGNLSNWKVDRVTNMECLFCRCDSLQSVGDLSKWNISPACNEHYIVKSCGFNPDDLEFNELFPKENLNEAFSVMDFDSWDDSEQTFKTDIEKSIQGLLFYDWDNGHDYKTIKYDWLYELKYFYKNIEEDEYTDEEIRPFELDANWLNSSNRKNEVIDGQVKPMAVYYEEDVENLPEEYLNSLEEWYNNLPKDKQEYIDNDPKQMISAIIYDDITEDTLQCGVTVPEFFILNGYRSTKIKETNFQYSGKVKSFYMINQKNPKEIVCIHEYPNYRYKSNFEYKQGLWTVEFLFMESEKWIPSYYI